MHKGFTLIELLIVVIIIGILATLAMPQYQTMVEKARAMEAVRMLGHLRTGQWLYYAQYGKFSDTTSTADSNTKLGITVTEHLFKDFISEAQGTNNDEGVDIYCKKKTAPFENYDFGMDENGEILPGGHMTGSAGNYKTAAGL